MKHLIDIEHMFTMLTTETKYNLDQISLYDSKYTVLFGAQTKIMGMEAMRVEVLIARKGER